MIIINSLSPQQPSPPARSSSFSELDWLLLLGTVGHALLLGSSSFVEEEHQIWYFLLTTLCLALFQEVCRKYFRERPLLTSAAQVTLTAAATPREAKYSLGLVQF